MKWRCFVTQADLKLVAKGKWYLHWFAQYTYQRIKQLKENCRNGVISSCRSCQAGNHQDCLFKTKQKAYNIDSLCNDLLQFIDEEECEDIMKAFTYLNEYN